MSDFFIINAEAENTLAKHAYEYLQRKGKTTFFPKIHIGQDELYGMSVLRGIKDAKEILLFFTSALEDDEKAMDLLNLAKSLKSENIKVIEIDKFKPGYELKSYLKKSERFGSLRSLLGLPDNENPSNPLSDPTEPYKTMRSIENRMVEVQNPTNEIIEYFNNKMPEEKFMENRRIKRNRFSKFVSK